MLNLLPSDTEYTKTFTVKNERNTNIEYGVYLIDVINQFTRKDDIKYTLNCTTDGTIACNKVTTEITFPSGIAHTFTFTYKDTGTDQSIDMNKVLSAKIQIFGKSSNVDFMPYEENSLAFNIISNAKLEKNGTTYRTSPLTTPALQTSSKFYTNKAEEATMETSIPVSTNYQSYYWTYGTGYTVDENTGSFTLTGVATCKYNDGTCNTTLVGKYLASNYAAKKSASNDTKQTKENLKNIYKVTQLQQAVLVQ